MPITDSKPTDDMRWATNGGVRTEPNEGHKDTGWIAGEVPTAQAFNYLQGVSYDWQTYFESATDQLDATKLDLTNGGTVAGASIFSGNLTIRSTSAPAYAAAGAQLKLQNTSDDVTAPTQGRTGISFTVGTSQPDGFDIDVYRSSEDNPQMVFYGVVDGAAVGGIMTLSKDHIALQQQVGFSQEITSNLDPVVTGQLLGTDTERWDCNFNDVSVGGSVTFETDDSVAKDESHINRLTRTNIVKCWGTLTCSGNVITAEDGFNWDVANSTVNATYIEIWFKGNMYDGKYAVAVTVDDNTNPLFCTVSTKGAVHFRIHLWEAVTGGSLNPNLGSSTKYSFMVVGRQEAP